MSHLKEENTAGVHAHWNPHIDILLVRLRRATLKSTGCPRVAHLLHHRLLVMHLLQGVGWRRGGVLRSLRTLCPGEMLRVSGTLHGGPRTYRKRDSLPARYR